MDTPTTPKTRKDRMGRREVTELLCDAYRREMYGSDTDTLREECILLLGEDPGQIWEEE